MVYCGKPSKGCQMCRTRRIKCDETKPTCNQCTKSRRQCPGYKDEFDLVFRNETQATERRARKAGRKAQAVSKTGKPGSAAGSESTSPPMPAGGARSPPEPMQTINPALNVPVEHQAGCHFVSNFILMPREGTARGFLDFVVPLLKQDPQGHLQHAFAACSMAFLNNRGGACRRFSDRALHAYTKALNGTNAALRNPETQLADSTLAAVLLLGLFETISAKQIGMLNWGSHTEGAIQLVKARGKKQLNTKTGLSLFVAVRTQMIIHSLTSGTAPIMGTEWWMDDAVRDGTAAKCHRLMIQIGELRAEVTRLMSGSGSGIAAARSSPASTEIMLATMRRAQALDRDVVAWMREVPADWRFRTVAWEDGAPHGDYGRAEVFPGRVDAYPDFYIASVWNTARAARLVLASLVVRCAAWVCAPGDYRTTPEYATAARTCVDTIADVVASVPCQLGWRLTERNRRRYFQGQGQPSQTQTQTSIQTEQQQGPRTQQDEPAPDTFAHDTNDNDHVKALAGYFLTWPLICAYSQDHATDAQRAWIRGRLRFIGDGLGVRYAHVLSHLQVRIPSMLIRRDAMMAVAAAAAAGQRVGGGMGMGMGMGMGQNYRSSAQTGLPKQHFGAAMGMQAQALAYAPQIPPGLSTDPYGGRGGPQGSSAGDNPLQHIEALQKERFEKNRAELLARAAGGSDADESQRWVAKRWLTV